MTTFAGSGEQSTVDGTGINSSFNRPAGISIDQESGEMYVAEWEGKSIRKLSPNGILILKNSIKLIGFS